LNPLSKTILEGHIRETDAVRVTTRGEAQNLKRNGKTHFGWVTGADHRSKDRNDIVIRENHDAYSENDSPGNVSAEDKNHFDEKLRA